MTLFAKGLHINHFGNLLLENALLPPSFSFYFRQSPRPLRYLSPVNPCSEGDTRSSLLLFFYTSSLFSSIRRVVIRDIRDLDDDARRLIAETELEDGRLLDGR